MAQILLAPGEAVVSIGRIHPAERLSYRPPGPRESRRHRADRNAQRERDLLGAEVSRGDQQEHVAVGLVQACQGRRSCLCTPSAATRSVTRSASGSALLELRARPQPTENGRIGSDAGEGPQEPDLLTPMTSQQVGVRRTP